MTFESMAKARSHLDSQVVNKCILQVIVKGFIGPNAQPIQTNL